MNDELLSPVLRATLRH